MSRRNILSSTCILFVYGVCLSVSWIFAFQFAAPTVEMEDASELDEETRKDLQSVIQQWTSNQAVNRKPGVIISSEFASLHLNESYNRFDKYTVQVNNSTYSTVHLQKRRVFDAAVIRKAFEISSETRSHVIFTSPFGIHGNPEGKMYFSCQLSNKSGYPYWIWLLRETLDKFKLKLGIRRCEELRSTNDFFIDVLQIDR